jgi:gliding motility-associated-like protein
MINESVDNRKNFVASVMATEDNTTVTLSDYDPDVVFTSGSGDITLDSQTFTLNAGQSIVFSGNSDVTANLDGIIGALITSSKPIAVNTGNALGGIEQNKADLTLDQIVSASQIGKEYVFIEGNGLASMENPLIVANEDGTTITINNNISPIITINAGEYYLVPNSYYQGTTNNKNIYVKTSKPVFAYQLLGGGASTASSGLNFIPPLSCFFQNSVNIPSVNEIGITNPPYTSDLMILTYSSSVLTVNSSVIPSTQAQAVLGNADWVSYKILNVTGNANVVSTGPLAVGVFGFIGAASGFAGYYSGFGSTPQDTNVTVCSNSTKDLFDTINGNPGTGGIWTVPSGGTPLNGNIFEPAINIPGEYIYSFTKDCNASQTNISVKVNVTIEQFKKAGISSSTSSCITTPSYDLFALLGTTADIGGTWSPTLLSGTSIFNPANEVSGIYSYSFSATNSCAGSSASIAVNNSVVPILNPITDFVKCDDTSDGSDTNGSVAFDLTTKTIEILGIQTGINVTYHNNQNDADLGQGAITTINSGSRLIYVRLEIIASGCHIVNTFNLVVKPLPTVNVTTIIQCDDDLNAITSFNLTVNNSLISNGANETFTYYTSPEGANANPPYDIIPNELAFQNTTPSQMDVWTRVTNSNGCYRVAKLTLKVLATNIPSTFNIVIPKVCDDLLDLYGFNTINNNNRDGVSSFNISSTETTIRALLPSTGVYNIKYYRNQADALAETNRITDLVNYRNIGYPTTQNIWVRVDSDVTNACYGLGPFVTVNVEALPIAHPVTILRQCDDNQDGIFNFNTTSLENDLLQGQTTGVTVTYYDAANNPLRDSNNNLITSRFPTSFSTTSQTIKAVVKNNTTLACSDETFIQFIVDKSPIDFTIPSTLTSMCDDEIDPELQNGIYNFTNSQAIYNIVTLNQPAGMVYEYYDENNVLLSTPLPDPLLVSLSKNIKIIVKNPINTTCSLTKTIQLIVNPTPKIDLEHSEIVCSNLSTFFVVITAGIVDGSDESNYTYKWYKDTVIIATETSSTLNVNSEGIYTVEVINTNGCSKTRTITVTASDVAHIGIATIVDLSFFNSVTINVTNPGLYAYSMDYPNLFQESNFFENVPAGIHEIFVKDLNGCGISQQTISVIGIPPYFTPNGDGVNDTWNVQGVSKDFNFNTTIYIFNRFGKLVKQLATTGNGWDGTLNGEPMPADDYWYAVYLEDGRISKGHFTLKR